MIRILLLLLLVSFSAVGQDKMVKYTFAKSFDEVVEAAKESILQKSLKVYNVIDYSNIVQGKVSFLRPTTAILFGDPKLEQKLIKCNQELAITLPLRILIWQDENKVNWIGFNNPSMEKGELIMYNCSKEFDSIYKLLNDICLKAAS